MTDVVDTSAHGGGISMHDMGGVVPVSVTASVTAPHYMTIRACGQEIRGVPRVDAVRVLSALTATLEALREMEERET